MPAAKKAKATPVPNDKPVNPGRDLLLAVAGKAATAPAKKDQKSESRTVLDLDEGTMDHFAVFVEAKTIGAICKGLEENHGAAVKEAALASFTEMLWRTRSVPANPEIATFLDPARRMVDNRALLLVKARFRPENSVPAKDRREPGRTARDYLYEALTAGPDGLEEEEANTLLDDEIDFTPRVDIHLHAMLSGRDVGGTWVDPTPAQVDVATRLLEVINSSGKNGRVTIDAFTQEDRDLLLDIDNGAVRMRNAKGFLNRIVMYCGRPGDLGLRQLRNILVVIPPDIALTSVKFAENVPADQAVARKLAAVNRVLGL